MTMRNNYSPGPGWQKLVDPLYDMCKAKGVTVLQVKEKFGGLRFYTGAADEEMFAAIDKAEAASLETCMICGEPGKTRPLGWVLTLCEQHYKEEVDARERRTTKAHKGT